VKLHTTLPRHEIQVAFRDVRDIGHLTLDISLVQFEEEPSKTHPYGHKIQLGTQYQFSLPNGKSRHYKNTKIWGDTQMWAASHDEWGWFIARIFELDPTARWTGGGGAYTSPEDFIKKTDGKYSMYLPDPTMWVLTAHP
jgi:hypothetical protein